MRQYWNESITLASYQTLQKLSKEFEFVLIGGWAVYLYTRAQKSKDIDIVVDYPSLRALDSAYALSKNERLKKYEIRQETFDIDIYAPNFSKLAVPAAEILANARSIEGIRTVEQHYLLLLKLGAFADRVGSAKGEKDAIDIVNLLYGCEFDRKRLDALGKKFGIADANSGLSQIVRDFPSQHLEFTNADFVSFKKWRREFLAGVR